MRGVIPIIVVLNSFKKFIEFIMKLIIMFLIFGFELHKRINLEKFKLESPINLVKDLSSNVLYLNKFGNVFFVSGMKNVSRKVAVIVDGLIIDGSVNFISSAFGKTSKITSATQTGLVRNYVVYFGLFLVLLISLFIFTPLVAQHPKEHGENMCP